MKKVDLFCSAPGSRNMSKGRRYQYLKEVWLQVRKNWLQHYVNRELPGVQAGFRKGEEPEIKLPISTGSSKKQESPEKDLFLLY